MPWQTLTVATVLGIGIAPDALIDGVLFKPLPFLRPSELFVVNPSYKCRHNEQAAPAALAGGIIPATRAARVDPVEVLRIG